MGTLMLVSPTELGQAVECWQTGARTVELFAVMGAHEAVGKIL